MLICPKCDSPLEFIGDDCAFDKAAKEIPEDEQGQHYACPRCGLHLRAIPRIEKEAKQNVEPEGS